MSVFDQAQAELNGQTAPAKPTGNVFDQAQAEMGAFDQAEIEEKKVSSWLGSFAKDSLKGLKRAGGVGLGAVGSPLAFVWGSQEAQHIDPKGYSKLPAWKKHMVDIGGGMHSAWRSLSKEGDFGTHYGDYWKTKHGKTIRESITENLNPDMEKDSALTYTAKKTWIEAWSPTVEFLMNVVSDPVIGMGEASKIAGLKIPAGAKAKMPKDVQQQIAKLERLDVAQKGVIRKTLKTGFESRQDYKNWWAGKLDDAEKMFNESKAVDKDSYQSFWERKSVGAERGVGKIGDDLIQPQAPVGKSAIPKAGGLSR